MRPTLVLLASALLLVSAADARAQQRTPAVVLISIDGLKPEYLLEADARGLKIPNLRALMAKGAHARGVTGVVPTVTYPSHTTLVTGAWPATHGIISNNTFDPLNRNQGGWYWYASDIKVPTLWDVVMRAGRTTGNVHWPVTVDANITWNLPQYWRTGMEDDRKVVRALSTAGLYDAMEKDVGVRYADGQDETIEGDELRGRFAARMVERRKPALMLAYFTALDHEQHGSGPFSAIAYATLERIDAIVGALVRASAAAYGSNVVVAIVSDHGFMPTTKSLNIIHALRTEGLVDYAAGNDDRPSAWRAITWGSGGSTAIVLHDTADVATRDKVGALLRRLAADSANGIDRVIDGAELRRRGGFPGAAFLVSLRSGYTTGGNSRGPLVANVKPGGTHGYLPDNAEMRASFVIAGPGVPAGRDLGIVDQRAIAPTLAKILGVSLPRAEVRGVF